MNSLDRKEAQAVNCTSIIILVQPQVTLIITYYIQSLLQHDSSTVEQFGLAAMLSFIVFIKKRVTNT